MRNKTNALLLGAVLSLLAIAAFGFQVADPQYFDQGFINGRAWQGLGQAGKLGYLKGLHEGFLMAASSIECGAGTETSPEARKKAVERFVFSSVSIGEVAKQIDQFYTDAANARLSVAFAYLIAKDRSQGMDENEVARKIAQARKLTQ